jgi:regulator of cell morphogenesis and NO signaling
MSTIAPLRSDSSLASLAASRAGASRVFHRHGLDFCCRGRLSLAEACAKSALDTQAILDEIASEEPRTAGFERWDEKPLPALIDHILTRYHEGHRREVPRLLAMAEKVEEVHADHPAVPRGLAAHLRRMSQELEDHMGKEEVVLFPMIRSGRGSFAMGPVQVMELEHLDHAANLERMRQLANDCTPPPDACATWKALYLGLAELEREIMEHIHLENHALFPRALQS